MITREDLPTMSGAEVGVRPLLSVRDLYLRRDLRPILQISQLDINSGEIVALIGPSGCGKTTLLSHISGTFPAAAGAVRFPQLGGTAVPRTYISRSVQGAPLLHWLNVRQNLELAARVRGFFLSNPSEVLARFAAEDLADRFPATLSGGERCRASLSQALVGDPTIVLLDEPFSGLDVAVKRFVAENVFRVARSAGAAVLMVTHDLIDAVEYADRVVVLGGSSPAHIVGEIEASLDAIPHIARLLER